jgi:tetratricopeptide (TPR) repeat protein
MPHLSSRLRVSVALALSLLGPSCTSSAAAAAPRDVSRAAQPSLAAPTDAPAARAEAAASDPLAFVSTPPSSFPAPGSLAGLIDQLDVKIYSAELWSQREPGMWMPLDWIAGFHLERARLSGDYDDYARAEDALARAFALAPAKAGPVSTRARLNFSLHRLPQVDEDLARMAKKIVQNDNFKARRIGLKADTALQRGRYAEALAGFEDALRYKRNITGYARLARYRWLTGDFERAERLYDQAERTIAPGAANTTRAWLNLQRGLMDLDRGRHLDALAHYNDAARAVPGYWLVDEHIAEILTLEGRDAQALALYRDIIRRTNNPEFMDAVAGILRAQGDEPGAREMIQRARAAYDRRLARFPEAAYGHALDHFLDFAKDPAKTVALAEANHTLRPGGIAKTKLARAYLAAGRLDDARALVNVALASPYTSAALHMIASEVFAAAGAADKGTRQRALALAINPRAVD